LRQADRNVEAGKYAAAEELYRQILTEAPQSTAAWLGLASILQNETERDEAYNQVLVLDPGNKIATAGLAGELLPKTADESAEASETPEVEAITELKIAEPPVLPETDQVSTAHSEDGATAHEHQYEVVDADVELFCYRHPTRATSLRCYKCNKPICSECTEKTPVGYLCPDCYREAEDAFYNARPTDYILAAIVALPISLLAGFLVMRFSSGLLFIIIMFFIGGAVGGFIGRITKRVIGQRRGRYIPHLVAACVIIGVLVWAMPALLGALFVNPGALFTLIGPGVYLATAVSSAYYWAR
jgi:hypothetical protein